MRQRRKWQKGFTLLETLISMSIFIIIFMSIVSIFIMTRRNFNSINEKTEIINNYRILIERIARDIRLGSIDYTDNWLQSTPENFSSELHLINDRGERVRYMIGENQAVCHEEFAAARCLMYGVENPDGSYNWTRFNPNYTPVDSASGFWIWPKVDPFVDLDNDNVFDSNDQPRVTIFFELNGPAFNEGDINAIQTTVSSRVYKR